MSRNTELTLHSPRAAAANKFDMLRARDVHDSTPAKITLISVTENGSAAEKSVTGDARPDDMGDWGRRSIG